jgi:hypothetical protein
MLKTILKITGILLLVIIQLSLFDKFSFFGSVPNFIIIFAISLTLKGKWQDAILLGLIGGLLLDLASPLKFGIYMLLILLAITLINFLILRSLPTPKLLMSFFIMTGSFLMINLLISLLTFTWLGWTALIDAVINGLWGVVAYWALNKFIKTENEIKIE